MARVTFSVAVVLGLAGGAWLTVPTLHRPRAPAESLLAALQSDDLAAFAKAVADLEDVNVTVSSCADRDAIDSPLGYAVLHERQPMIELLLSLGADPTWTGCPAAYCPLVFAVTTGYVEGLEVFLKHGADVNYVDPLRGRTLLATAVSFGTIEIVRLLLDNGADPTLRTAHSDPILCVASGRREDSGIVQLLISRGAEIDATDADGGSALHHAAHPDIARLLMNYGLDPNALDAHGNSPLHTLVRHPSVLEVLLHAGADRSKRNRRGETAFDVAKVLTETGAAASIPDASLQLLRPD